VGGGAEKFSDIEAPLPVSSLFRFQQVGGHIGAALNFGNEPAANAEVTVNALAAMPPYFFHFRISGPQLANRLYQPLSAHHGAGYPKLTVLVNNEKFGQPRPEIGFFGKKASWNISFSMIWVS
jgi:hypothetical protein